MLDANTIGDGQSIALILTAALTFFIGAFGGYIAACLRLTEVERYKLQLKHVRKASFQKQKLMNYSEFQVFRALEQDVALKRRGLRVFAQPSLGEILRSDRKTAFNAINAKRVDILIVDKAGLPLLAIEYQGEGHYDDTSETRDAIKREALLRAGVGYLEVFPKDGAEKMLDLVHKRLGWTAPSPGDARDMQQRVQAAIR
jgi:hypothetical protein